MAAPPDRDDRDIHAPPEGSASEAGDRIPAEEEALLARVRESLAARAAEAAPRRRTAAATAGAAATTTTTGAGSGSGAAAAAARYDQELIALRDEIAEARLEDVAALVAQMERLQGVSLQRAEARAVLVDPDAPYFGHLRLREEGGDGRSVTRDVFVGRATFVDAARRVH